MSNFKESDREIDQLENGTPSDKVIEIKSIYKNGKRSIQPALDASSGWWAGVERLSDEAKSKLDYYVTVGETGQDSRLNTTIVLKNGLTFNLAENRDAINWAWVKHCPELAMSLDDAQKGKAEFYVHMEGRESERSNRSEETIYEATKYVMEDATTEYANRALLLGFDMSHEKPASIKQFLIGKAKKDPKAILNIYRNKSMRINLLFVKAKQKGVVTVNKADGVVKYGATILGVSDDSAIAYLQQNEDILELLDREINPQFNSAKAEEVNVLEGATKPAAKSPSKAPAKGTTKK